MTQHPAQHLELDVHGLQHGGMLGEAALGASDALLPLWERHKQHRVSAQAYGGTRDAALLDRVADARQPSPVQQQHQLSAWHLQRESPHPCASALRMRLQHGIYSVSCQTCRCLFWKPSALLMSTNTVILCAGRG